MLSHLANLPIAVTIVLALTVAGLTADRLGYPPALRHFLGLTTLTILQRATQRMTDVVKKLADDKGLDVVVGQAAEPGKQRPAERRRVRGDDESAELRGVAHDVALLRAGDDAQLVARRGAHPLGDVVDDGAATDDQHLLRAVERLQAGRVPGGRDDPDDRHVSAASRTAA